MQSKNDKVREKMFALRETWKDVFLPTKLYTIDVKVNQIDPNWPIAAKVAKKPTIHVNPNFLKKVSTPKLVLVLEDYIRTRSLSLSPSSRSKPLILSSS